jgi:acyl-CoA synthetase (AMP-forming)/AMP-acid ligase II
MARICPMARSARSRSGVQRTLRGRSCGNKRGTEGWMVSHRGCRSPRCQWISLVRGPEEGNHHSRWSQHIPSGSGGGDFRSPGRARGRGDWDARSGGAHGERLVAFITVREGFATDEQQLKDHARQRLADFKVPERFVFLKELQKGITGKVQRRALKEIPLAAA